LVLLLAGIAAYARQLRLGLVISHLSDQVNWGLYISNFMFVGGVAASAMVLVIAASLYGRSELRAAMLVGVCLSLAGVVMGAMFVQADLGRPDRIWHLLPVIGVYYFPWSMLAWDVLALNVYLVLSLCLAVALPYRRFRGSPAATPPLPRWVGMVVIAGLLFLLLVEASLFSGFVARPLWNTAVLVPRFLASAFVAGPALLLLILQVTQRTTGHGESEGATTLLSSVLRLAIQANLLLAGMEAFVQFYHPGPHTASARYLYFGLEGQTRLVAWNWGGIALAVFALAVLSVRGWRGRPLWLNLACGAAAVSVWIEKGMGLIWAGFIPSPMGEVMEYLPSLAEILVSVGIVAAGLIVFTFAAKVSLSLEDRSS
jgi:molybdopterin-containing oxidoreductase family membrane subunit